MASALGTSSTGGSLATERVKGGIELLSASIRSKARSIQRVRLRMRRLRTGEMRRLDRLLITYEALSGVRIPNEKAVSGEFP